MPRSDHPSIDLMIAGLLGLVAALALIACFHKVANEQSFGIIVTGVLSAFASAWGTKSALTQGGPAPKQAMEDKIVPPANGSR